jgi:dTDP-4-amino-4,6-dideoxygalactose transaminase
VGPGDRVWTVPNTFVASANCALHCGASIDFVDIDSTTYNISVSHLAQKLVDADRRGTLPKVVIPVHFGGTPCDLRAIHLLAKRYGFRVIEDASHAIGARYGGSVIGDCQFSDVTVFSFHPVKILTTGEGGIGTTRSPEISRAMQLYRSHGVTREEGELEKTDEGPWYYEQHLLGFNYRMTDMAAALGLSQLQNLDAWVARRNQLADWYDEALSATDVVRPTRPRESRSAMHLYPIQADHRAELFDQLHAGGVGVNVHYIPVHTQPIYRRLGFRSGDFPNSERFYARCLSLPMHVGLSRSDQELVVDLMKRSLRRQRAT